MAFGLGNPDDPNDPNYVPPAEQEAAAMNAAGSGLPPATQTAPMMAPLAAMPATQGQPSSTAPLAGAAPAPMPATQAPVPIATRQPVAFARDTPGQSALAQNTVGWSNGMPPTAPMVRIGPSELATVDPKRQAQIQANLGLAADATREQGSAASGAALAEGATQERIAGAIQSDADEALDRLRDRKGDYAANIAKLAAAQDDAAKAGIDPDRLAKGKSPAEKFALALGAALAAGSQTISRTGGPNPVLQQMQQAKEADIEAQRQDITNKRAKVGDLRAQIADMARQNDADEGLVDKAAALRVKGLETGGAADVSGYRSQLADAAAAKDAAILGAQGEKEIAAMNRFAQAHAVGGAPAASPAKIAEAAMKIREDAAARGVNVPIGESINQATALLTLNRGYLAQSVAKPAAGSSAASMAPPDFGAPPKSTELRFGIPNPAAYTQFGGDAHANQINQGRFNAQLLSAIHTYGGQRELNAQREVAGPFLIEPGDTDAEIARKYKGAQSLVTNLMKERLAAMGKGGVAPTADDDVLDTELGK